jgi:hypothetical protein
MPSGSFSLTDNSAFVVPSLSWFTSDNAGANQSTLTVVFNAYTTGTQNTFGTFSGGITIDGLRYAISGQRTIVTGGAGVVTEIGRASRDITHNSDGSRSVAVSADGGIPGTSWTTTSGGGTAVLTDYNRSPTWIDNSVDGTATRGTAYSDGVSANAASSYGIVSNRLPYGLSLNTSNGAITGTPTTVESQSFTIRAYGSFEGSIDTALSINVRPALPVFSDGSVSSSARVGIAYSDGVSASETSSYSVVAAPNNLPPGLSLNTSNGAITGTPTTPGTYSFKIRATNVTGSTDTATLTITVISAARVWNGTAFVSGLANVWNGSAFVTGTIRVWDGSTWKNTN